MKQPDEVLIKSIISRVNGIIDEEKASKIYKDADITVKGNDEIVINGKASVVLDKLTRSLIKDGNYLVKITLHNLAQENGLNICPLCRDVNKNKENVKAETKEYLEELNKDISVKMLHSSSKKKIILITLRNSSSLDDHAADCPIMVLCISGKGTFETGGKSQDIREGSLINLDAKVVHRVKADNKLELLVTKFIAV